MKKGNANAKRNGYIGLGAMILLAGATIFGSDPLYKAIDNSVRPAVYIPGTYTGTARGYGGTVTAEVTVTAKSIESIEVKGEKETLLDLVVPGLTDTIIAKQSTEVDAVSGATLSSTAIKEAVDQALAQARGEAAETEPETQEEAAETAASQWKDGTYTYESPEFDKNGFKDQIEMTIKDNAITSLTWDCVKEDGSKKSQLSMDGQYVMTENGPKWHEQAEAVVKYVLDNQSVEGLANADGYTDAISSVSINLNGFVNGVKDCLSQASGGTAERTSLKDGTYSYESPEFDKNGFKDQVEMTVKDNTITSLTWDCIKEDGTKKSQLSMDGQYVMTENGPKWHEQAEAVVKYVLDNQSVEGLVNADGYTDAISSVSINLSGFVNGVKDCLSQAAQK
ncbi:FMN-binding protein [Clostridium sp. Marseille-P2415]|uniref:FMN-binding protein n=1 Tax=Clostridium sp. Marseille-P2415 TaxID=1805471 RepID=UPI000988332A|nr:FMN-binding protein [Clostridium sp. Marseille-P2415]